RDVDKGGLDRQGAVAVGPCRRLRPRPAEGRVDRLRLSGVRVLEEARPPVLAYARLSVGGGSRGALSQGPRQGRRHLPRLPPPTPRADGRRRQAQVRPAAAEEAAEEEG